MVHSYPADLQTVTTTPVATITEFAPPYELIRKETTTITTCTAAPVRRSEDERDLTNAERLRRGLPLAAPKQLEKRGGHHGGGHHHPEPSCTPKREETTTTTTKTKTITPTSTVCVTECKKTKTLDVTRESRCRRCLL